MKDQRKERLQGLQNTEVAHLAWPTNQSCRSPGEMSIQGAIVA